MGCCFDEVGYVVGIVYDFLGFVEFVWCVIIFDIYLDKNVVGE